MTDIAAASEAEVIDAVRAARDWKSPLNIVGARTKRRYGRAVASWGTVLDLSGLNGVIAYEPEELILTVCPGTPVAEIDALLAAKNQRLGFDPPGWGPLFGAPAGRGTIGGAIAADVAGSRAVRYGRARDHLLGFHAVNGLGEAYKAGGRVVKNVTGFDLPKLMCGAFGTLGPMTELTLRVFPKPSSVATLMLHDVSPVQGFDALRRIWSSPLDATGLAYVPACAAFAELSDSGTGAALFRVEGAAEPLQEKIAALRTLLGDVQEVADGDAIFRKLGGGAPFVGYPLDVWRVVLPPASAARCAQALASPLWYADWAGGLIWAGFAGDDSQAARVRAIAESAGGHATLIRASDEMRARIAVFQPEPLTRAALTRSVKAAFDPLGIFNPGRMYEGV
jgi:glycolate oxidase FAD binding subunit